MFQCWIESGKSIYCWTLVSKDVWRNPKPIRVFIFDQFNNSFPLPWLSSYIHCTMQWVSLGNFLTILRLALSLLYSIPSSPPEIFSGVDFILYVCPTVQPSQVSQSPDESGLGNQLSSQPMRSQENWSPLAKESFCKSTDNQHWECRLTETNISLCPLAQHWNLWTGTLPFGKSILQNLKLLFWLIVTKVKKFNMGWKENKSSLPDFDPNFLWTLYVFLFHLPRPTLLENAPDRDPSTLLCTFLRNDARASCEPVSSPLDGLCIDIWISAMITCLSIQIPERQGRAM